MSNTIQSQRLLPLSFMARRLRVPVKWLRAEAESGRIPCIVAGSAILFDAQRVEAELLARAQRKGGSNGR